MIYGRRRIKTNLLLFFIMGIVSLMLSGAVYAVAVLLDYMLKVRGWSREGAWEKFAF